LLFYFQVKGISISQFYNNERHQAETFETGFYGYRGLTGEFQMRIKLVVVWKSNAETGSSSVRSMPLYPYNQVPQRFGNRKTSQSFKRRRQQFDEEQENQTAIPNNVRDLALN
jgi:hypothetical protein